MLKYDFKGKTILITAASKGIGFELARQMTLYGANVSICSRNLSNLKAAKNKILSFKKDGKLLTGKEALKESIRLGIEAEKYIQPFLDPPHRLEYEKKFDPFILFSKNAILVINMNLKLGTKIINKPVWGLS